MGRRGPRKKPAAIVAIDGRRSDDPPRNDLRPTGGPLGNPPAGMQGDARKFWRSMGPEFVRLNLITDLDREAFAQVCTCYGRMRLAARKLLRLRDDVTCAEDIKIRRYWLMMEKEARIDYLRLSQRFGLTPGDRAGLVVPTQWTPSDDDWFSEHEAKS